MKKLLVIEDESVLRNEISELLRLEGYEVIEADNGINGIELAFAVLPDLILCDIMMPGLNGMEVLAQLHSRELTSRIPFIFMSALAERKHLRSGMELGADDYIPKPFTVQEVLQAVRTRLNRSEAGIRFLESEIQKVRDEINRKWEAATNLLFQSNEQGKQDETGKKPRIQSGQEDAIVEALSRIDSNNTLKNLERLVEKELSQPGISKETERIFIKLKNEVRNRHNVMNNWMIFQMKFNQTNPHFIENLVARFPGLSQQDLTLASAISINLNTLQLAGMLNITTASVRTSRYRLKKKLGLKKSDKLMQFLSTLNKS